MVIVGTHCDKLKSDEREKRKKELNHVIYQKYLVGRGPQQLKEMGLPKILDVIYVGCPLNGRAEGVPELRMALYDISFSLTALRRSEYLTPLKSVCTHLHTLSHTHTHTLSRTWSKQDQAIRSTHSSQLLENTRQGATNGSQM